MDKVIFTKEVVLAFDEFMFNRDKEEALNDIYLYKDRIKSFEGVSYSDLVRAIIYGYEVELTEEEKLANVYKSCRENSIYDQGVKAGVELTIRAFKLEVKGINA